MHRKYSIAAESARDLRRCAAAALEFGESKRKSISVDLILVLIDQTCTVKSYRCCTFQVTKIGDEHAQRNPQTRPTPPGYS